MSRERLSHSAAASLMVLAAATALPAQDEAAFEQGYARVRDLLQKEKWADGRSALDALLAAHERQLYVLAQQSTIVEDYRRCCFALETPTPRPQELISGEVQSWSPASGRIKLRYTQKSLGDWVQEKDTKGRALFVHPAAFKGDYSVSCRGTLGGGENFIVLFDVLGNSTGVADFGGSAGGRAYYRVRLFERTDAGEHDMLAKDNQNHLESGRFSATLKVTATRVQMFVNGSREPLAEGARPKGPFGQVGFTDAGIEEVVLEGSIEPSWFQNVVDQRLADLRAAFDEKFVPAQRLPAWLFAEPAGGRTAAKFRAQYPGLDGRARPTVVQAAFAAVAKGDWTALRNTVEPAAADDLPAVLKEFLLGLALVRGGAPVAALTHVDAALQLAPEFTWTRALRAQCFDALRRHGDAQAEYEQAIASDPGEARLYAEAMVEMLRHGRVDAARALIKNAKVRHGLWEEMRPLDQVLAMLERGPQWPRRCHAQSPNYYVWSDIDQRTCQQACSILEESLVNLKAQFTWIKDDKNLGRFRVYLFAGQAGYADYCKQILGSAPAHTAGLYSPVLKQLLIWNLPKREEMEKTIRHEGFHQFLDRALIDPPSWFNEGMAEFWETARREKDRFTGGQVRTDHIATLMRSRQSLPSLQDFAHGSYRDFYANAPLRYAQGWALVHFLRKGPPPYQKVFPALWEALRTDSPLSVAVDKGFAGVDWQKLEADFWSYLTALK